MAGRELLGQIQSSHNSGKENVFPSSRVGEEGFMTSACNEPRIFKILARHFKERKPSSASSETSASTSFD